MSRDNLDALQIDEVVSSSREPAAGEPDWGVLRGNIERALSSAFVRRHYLPSKRLQMIYGGTPPTDGEGKWGTLKSSATMNIENNGHPDKFGGTAENTGDCNARIFGNHGFLFFYIDPEASKEFRKTRFGDARITLSLDLVARAGGWAMLTDFRGREWPTQRYDKTGKMIAYPRGHVIGKPVSDGDMRAKYPSVADRSPEGGIIRAARTERNLTEGKDSDLTFKRIVNAEDPEEAKALLIDLAMNIKKARTDRVENLANSRNFEHRSRQYIANDRENKKPQDFGGKIRHYGPVPAAQENVPANAPAKDFAMPPSKNLLVGGDVVPGLAQFIVVEIARMHEMNPIVAAPYLKMTPEEVIENVVRKAIRPQVMLPRSISFTPQDVEDPSS
ncbi:hypothetical protein [Frankia sp. AgKG'84/4]|uniref:hypothetical protein n=1 Tax=Frankia sp. AgKG'84/4 TaxID=573490 RepID=UPI00200E7D60|nr:hypothetical protein [Frankia sp. AgKG'84/4]MCL9793967.1 hypothetical protein [Frankia sp. AgKG'84/4]